MIPTINNQREALQWETYAIGHCGNQEPEQASCHYYSKRFATDFFGADSRASLIIDVVKKIVTLTFRGTANLINVFNDLSVDPVSLQWAMQSQQELVLQVHTGFAREYRAMQNAFNHYRVYDVLQALVNQEDWHILLTGPSLGSALATLCAADLLLRGAFSADKIALITFGSPRTGDSAFAQWIDQAGLYKNIRVEIDCDPVVTTPVQFAGAYWHRGCLTRIQFCNGEYQRIGHAENSGESNGILREVGNVVSGSIKQLPCSFYVANAGGIVIDAFNIGLVYAITRGDHIPYLSHIGYWDCREYKKLFPLLGINPENYRRMQLSNGDRIDVSGMSEISNEIPPVVDSNFIPCFDEKAGKLSESEIAHYLWLDQTIIISEDILQKVNHVAVYLKERGFELMGVQADGNCFCNAFLGSYATLSRKIPILDNQENKISYLRDMIAQQYLANKKESQVCADIRRAEQIKQNGEWLTTNEGDLLATSLYIPIRIIVIEQDANGYGVSDMLTFSEKNREQQDWNMIDENERPNEYILIIDIGGHFLYAQPLSKKNAFLRRQDQIV